MRLTPRTPSSRSPAIARRPAARSTRRLLVLAAAAVLAACGATGSTLLLGGSLLVVRNLVSDGYVGVAERTDPSFQDPWGIAGSSTGTWYVVVRGAARVDRLDDQGAVLGAPFAVSGGPMDVVVNESAGFVVAGAPADAIVASQDGTISAWHAGMGSAVVVVDASASGASYTGLAILGDRLYATDFANGRVDVYDETFASVDATGLFAPPGVAGDFLPFGIEALGGRLFVTYAQNAGGEPVAGAGNGYLEVFAPDGTFVSEVEGFGERLDAPWGLALAPIGFGAGSQELLVGNVGDGRVLAFHEDDDGHWWLDGPLVCLDAHDFLVLGLHGIGFLPPGLPSSDAMFFAGATGGPTHGLFGRVDG